MKEILITLQMTQDEYENLVFQQYFNWCGRNCAGLEELQNLTANSRLYAWWKKEYENFENDFLFEISPYRGNTSKKDAYLLYIKNVHKMQLYYSKPMIEIAKRTQIDQN